MMTVEDCLKKAFAALLRGDTAERDRYCDLAKNLMSVAERLEAGEPPARAVAVGEVIRLPNNSGETPQ